MPENLPNIPNIDPEGLEDVFDDLFLSVEVAETLLTPEERKSYSEWDREIHRLEALAIKEYGEDYSDEIDDLIERHVSEMLPEGAKVCDKLIKIADQLTRASGKDSPDI